MVAKVAHTLIVEDETFNSILEDYCNSWCSAYTVDYDKATVVLVDTKGNYWLNVVKTKKTESTLFSNETVLSTIILPDKAKTHLIKLLKDQQNAKQ